MRAGALRIRPPPERWFPGLKAREEPKEERSRKKRSTMSAVGPSAVFILDSKGKILISRNYRGDVPMSAAERFVAKITEDEDMNIKPVIEEDGITYIYIKTNNIFLLATTARNANAAVVLMFLYRLVAVRLCPLLCLSAGSSLSSSPAAC